MRHAGPGASDLSVLAMTEPGFLTATRGAYDTVGVDCAQLVGAELTEVTGRVAPSPAHRHAELNPPY